VAARKPPPAKADPVEAYARAVVGNDIATGRLVRLACERHIRDLAEGGARGLRFDHAAASRAIAFFPTVLVHSKGALAGQPFELLDWQKFVVGSLFGWKMGNIRRFRTVFVSTGRKNCKSTLEAGIGLKALIDEGEAGAEIYSAATTRDQARIVFSEAERMRAASPALRRRITATINNLAVIETASWFRPLSADASRMDGLNVFVALVDEVHEHPNADVIEKLDTGMGARLQPIMYETTTAGVNRHSICYQHWDFSTKVLEGSIPEETADRWFAYIATVDEDDDWQDELAWRKANPSLGTLLRIEDLRAEVAIAREMPARQNSIRRLRLNQWTQQLVRWIDMDVWAQNGGALDIEVLRGRSCIGGLDLARINDLSSLALVFPPQDAGERWAVLWRHWCPEENILERERRDRAPYSVWRQQGHLTATEGNTTDFKFIEAEILISMGPATAEFSRKLLAREMCHCDDPVATWCASNVTVRTDPAGNQKPDKERSIERIDPIVAVIMAVGRSQAAQPLRSRYEDPNERMLFV
jgi:phage terminase large subunit-like protein